VPTDNVQDCGTRKKVACSCAMALTSTKNLSGAKVGATSAYFSTYASNIVFAARRKHLEQVTASLQYFSSAIRLLNDTAQADTCALKSGDAGLCRPSGNYSARQRNCIRKASRGTPRALPHIMTHNAREGHTLAKPDNKNLGPCHCRDASRQRSRRRCPAPSSRNSSPTRTAPA